EPEHTEALAGIEQIKAVYWQRAVAAQSEEDWVTAWGEWEQVLAIDGEDEAARSELANVVEAEALEAEINRLLQLAGEQFSAGRLTSPQGDSALASYRAILNHEPQHAEALAGIEQIKAVYMERVRSELEAVLAIDGEDEAARAALVEVLQAEEEQKPTFEMIGGDSPQPENKVGENTLQSDSLRVLENSTSQAVQTIPEDRDIVSEIQELLSRE
ncbi:MAG: hypothetical protein OEU36_20460, partial [Gammaproteobacteria bacterium]|nr:hypothetical protein [Gammaproteobacteria bacterium]